MEGRNGSTEVEAAIAAFVDSAVRSITPWLASFGFAQAGSESGRWTASVSFVNDKRYIRLTASSDPRDPPGYCNIVLGEGDLKWPEVDWNGIGLWQLATEQGHRGAAEYGALEAENVVPDLVERMRGDIERYGLPFLRGDVSVFRRVRAASNRTREPYQIHKPNGDGTYRTEVDPESSDLKARFS